MKVVYSEDHRLHNPAYEFSGCKQRPYLETPARAEAIAVTLKAEPSMEFVKPRGFSDDYVLGVHSPEYVLHIRDTALGLTDAEQVIPDFFPRGYSTNPEQTPPVVRPGYFCLDTYTPIVRGTYDAARSAVDTALTGASLVLEEEEIVYALTRPAGHHAGRDFSGGGCYFNNAAIAASFLTQSGTVAILDIDFHHGNGTQEIFYDRDDVLTISIHGDPRRFYPYVSGQVEEKGQGKGTGFNHNFPLYGEVTNSRYLSTLDSALELVQEFGPGTLVVAAGFDTCVYERGEFADFSLSPDCYEQIAAKIHSVGVPILVTQEGGFNLDYLGSNVLRFLRAFGR